MHRQVIRSLSVEETFEQPQAVYSARVVEVEELDDEDWEEYIPKEKHEETRRSFVSRRPQKAPETKTTPLRRSKRHQEKHRASIASKGSGDEDEANSSDQVFNLGNYFSTNEHERSQQAFFIFEWERSFGSIMKESWRLLAQQKKSSI
ncbi:unnamed protein product, partial [Mesorhabditis belari]|uniref:Uncharacterized protein n=1 Tax=Mesorhabditis belari TaxID=2138241 RepID=A0AAF3EFZ3_9BILA